MAVSELEQRYVPLTKSQPVWQPWGPAGRYPLDEGHDGEEEEVPGAQRRHPGSWQRSHSWSGYTTSAQRQEFQADSQQPSEGFVSDLKADEASHADGGELEAGGRAGIFCRQDASPTREDGAEGPAHHERHARSPQAPFEEEQPVREGGSMLTCGSAVDHAAAGPVVYASSGQHTDTQVGLHDESQCSSDQLGSSSQPSENSWENYYESAKCDSPHSDGRWGQAVREARALWPHPEAQAFCGSPGDEPSYPSDAGRFEPGSRKHGRRGQRAGKPKPSSEAAAATGITTLMVQNLPYSLSRDDLVSELDRCGYGGLFNFCHVPRTFATGKNQGVAFVNFLSPEIAERFAGEWHGNRLLLGMSPFGKALRVKVAAAQGIEACEKIAQSRRMKRVKTGTFKPLIISGQVPEASGAP